MGLEAIILLFKGADGLQRRVIIKKRLIELQGQSEAVWQARVRLPSGRVWMTGGSLAEVVSTVRQRVSQL
jgi:hypothetical protein